MNPEQTKHVKIRNADPRFARTEDAAFGTDDIGLPEDIAADNAVRPDDIAPEPVRAGAEPAPEQEARPDDDSRPDEPERREGRMERLVRKAEPTGHRISDDELRDPGRMTPDSPPTDNRS
jgi:hypothetical protein